VALGGELMCLVGLVGAFSDFGVVGQDGLGLLAFS
jgi:hypothetical protein